MEFDLESRIAIFIEPKEYMHHLNEVLGVTNKKIIYLKRKFISGAGYEAVNYDIEDCINIEIHDETPPMRMFFGVLVIILMLSIFYGIYIFWSEFEPGTRITIGLFGLALFYGFKWLLGARRHRVVFHMKNSEKLTFKSSPGDFFIKNQEVQNLVEFANSRGLSKVKK